MNGQNELPPELGKVYDAINDDVIYLHAAWNVFRALFAEKDAVDLVNCMFPFAGRTIQDALIDTLLLQITRLCDPAESGGGRNKNLTFERLITELPNSASTTFTDELAAKLAEIKSLSAALRGHRDKRIAHSDLKHAVDADSRLPGFSRETIEQTLNAIREFMNLINMRFRSGDTHYEEPIVRGGGDALVRSMKAAKKLLDLQNRAWKPGVTPDEIFSAVRDRSL